MNKYLVAFVIVYLAILTFLFVEQTYYGQSSWRTIPNDKVRSWSDTLVTILIIQTIGVVYYLHQKGKLTTGIKLIAGLMAICIISLTVINAVEARYNLSNKTLSFFARLFKAVFGLGATMLISSVLQHSIETSGIINEWDISSQSARTPDGFSSTRTPDRFSSTRTPDRLGHR